MAERIKNRHYIGFLAVIFVSVWFALDAIRTNFVVLDEYGHVPAGISYWQLGRFSLYRENPPLIQALAALPPLFSGAKMDYSGMGRGRSEWAVGQAFLNTNASRIHSIFTGSRAMILSLCLVSGMLIFWWPSKLYGNAAAVGCAALWLLDPNVLAFSTVVTTDVGSACTCLLAAYAFWRFLNQPGFGHAMLAGVTLGLAEGSKFNMLILYPTWVLLVLVSQFRLWPDLPKFPIGKITLLVMTMFGFSLLVLNSLYKFDGSFAPLGVYNFKSQALSGEATADLRVPPSDNRFRETLIAWVPVPFPRDYILGLDSQRHDSELGLTDIRNGQTFRGGRWYSPLRTLMFKLPLGTLVLFASSLFYWIVFARGYRFGDWILWGAAISLLGLLCTQTGLNWPVRYSISILALLAVASGALIARLLSNSIGRPIVVTCLAYNFISLLNCSPLFISYANPIAGGPLAAQSVFHGSNYDWGQDLYRLRQWYDLHPKNFPLAVTYFGAVPPEFVGVPEGALPSYFVRSEERESTEVNKAQRSFYWAISSNFLNGVNGRFRLDDGSYVIGRLRSPFLTPENAITRIGSSIYVFAIEEGSINIRGLGSNKAKCLESCIVPEPVTGLGLDATP